MSNMFISDKVKFKSRIIEAIMENENIITLLEPDPGEPILYKYILPFNFVPNPPDESKCYICVELDVPRINSNEWFKDAALIIRILCHHDFMKTEYGGNRIDMIEGILREEFNWRVDYGLELKLFSSLSDATTQRFYHTALTFSQLQYNDLVCGVKRRQFEPINNY